MRDCSRREILLSVDYFVLFVGIVVVLLMLSIVVGSKLKLFRHKTEFYDLCFMHFMAVLRTRIRIV